MLAVDAIDANPGEKLKGGVTTRLSSSILRDRTTSDRSFRTEAHSCLKEVYYGSEQPCLLIHDRPITPLHSRTHCCRNHCCTHPG
jgi:hypothetical protein